MTAISLTNCHKQGPPAAGPFARRPGRRKSRQHASPDSARIGKEPRARVPRGTEKVADGNKPSRSRNSNSRYAATRLSAPCPLSDAAGRGPRGAALVAARVRQAVREGNRSVIRDGTRQIIDDALSCAPIVSAADVAQRPSNGFQTGDVGSIPSVRSKCLSRRAEWCEDSQPTMI